MSTFVSCNTHEDKAQLVQSTEEAQYVRFEHMLSDYCTFLKYMFYVRFRKVYFVLINLQQKSWIEFDFQIKQMAHKLRFMWQLKESREIYEGKRVRHAKEAQERRLWVWWLAPEKGWKYWL